MDDEDTHAGFIRCDFLNPGFWRRCLLARRDADRAFGPFAGRALDIIEHFAAAPAIAADDVTVAARAQIIEVLARHHAAIANEDDAFEPEALFEVTHHIGNGLGVAPIALEYVMRNRPTVDHDQTDEYLRVARFAVAAVAVGAKLGRTGALEIGRGQIVEHHIDLQREQIPQPKKQRQFDLVFDFEQMVERAIPLLELLRLDAHARGAAGLAFHVISPGRDEAPAAAITDKITLQPLI